MNNEAVTVTGAVTDIPLLEYEGPGETCAELQFTLTSEGGGEYAVFLPLNPLEDTVPPIRQHQIIRVHGCREIPGECIEMRWYEHLNPAGPGQLPPRQ